MVGQVCRELENIRLDWVEDLSRLEYSWKYYDCISRMLRFGRFWEFKREEVFQKR